MEIKVGELVRTHKGIIGTLQSQELTYPEPSEWILNVNGKEVVIVECDDYITKHSENLIDLIEVGDIVFIEDVLNNDFVYIYDDEMLEAVREDVEEGLQITKILTHELFEANCYRVKGE